MKIKFEINKLGLIRAAFKFNYWKSLDKILWKKFRDEPTFYFFNTKHTDWALDELMIQSEIFGIHKKFQETASGLQKIYKEVVKSSEFKKLLTETKKYKNFVNNQWKKNENYVISFIQNELGIKVPNKTIKVFIFHPNFLKGNANDNYISWGHKEDWKNYSTVYIAHELLHILTKDKNKDKNLIHAIIELATDNELRIRLNKRGKYFKEGKYSVGHNYLRDLEKKLLSKWNKYLSKRKPKSILEL